MDTLKDNNLFRQQCVIDGIWRNAASGSSVPVTNPATQGIIGHVPDVSGDETREAIAAARAAFAPGRPRPMRHGQRSWKLGTA